jgi:hypothetical protein
MRGLAWRSVIDCPLNLASGFVALIMYVGLFGAVTLTIASTVSSGRARPRRFDGASLMAASRAGASTDAAGRDLAGAVR